MADLFSYPFRINPDGSVAKTPEGEESYADELANLILTSPGERHLVPEYGITDPVFDSLNTVELFGKIEMFGPPVTISDEDISIQWPRDGVLDININYSRDDTGEDDMVANGSIDDTDDDYYDDDDDEPTVPDPYGFNVRTDY